MGIYITGDCHGLFNRFGRRYFRFESDDYVIIAGDFGGVWDNSDEEKYWLKWLSDIPTTFLFVDGNHENFDLLNTYPEVEFMGGMAHKIRDNIYHLERGYIFDIAGKKVFAFGGASSHDKEYRVENESWWRDELPTNEELIRGRQTMKDAGWNVDFIVSHCCPTEVAICLSPMYNIPDVLTTFFGDIARKAHFDKWYFGHYHTEQSVFGKFECLYEKVKRIA